MGLIAEARYMTKEGKVTMVPIQMKMSPKNIWKIGPKPVILFRDDRYMPDCTLRCSRTEHTVYVYPPSAIYEIRPDKALHGFVYVKIMLPAVVTVQAVHPGFASTNVRSGITWQIDAKPKETHLIRREQ